MSVTSDTGSGSLHYSDDDPDYGGDMHRASARARGGDDGAGGDDDASWTSYSRTPSPRPEGSVASQAPGEAAPATGHLQRRHRGGEEPPNEPPHGAGQRGGARHHGAGGGGGDRRGAGFRKYHVSVAPRDGHGDVERAASTDSSDLEMSDDDVAHEAGGRGLPEGERTSAARGGRGGGDGGRALQRRAGEDDSDHDSDSDTDHDSDSDRGSAEHRAMEERDPVEVARELVVRARAERADITQLMEAERARVHAEWRRAVDQRQQLSADRAAFDLALGKAVVEQQAATQQTLEATREAARARLEVAEEAASLAARMVAWEEERDAMRQEYEAEMARLERVATELESSSGGRGWGSPARAPTPRKDGPDVAALARRRRQLQEDIEREEAQLRDVKARVRRAEQEAADAAAKAAGEGPTASAGAAQAADPTLEARLRVAESELELTKDYAADLEAQLTESEQKVKSLSKEVAGHAAAARGVGEEGGEEGRRGSPVLDKAEAILRTRSLSVSRRNDTIVAALLRHRSTSLSSDRGDGPARRPSVASSVAGLIGALRGHSPTARERSGTRERVDSVATDGGLRERVESAATDGSLDERVKNMDFSEALLEIQAEQSKLEAELQASIDRNALLEKSLREVMEDCDTRTRELEAARREADALVMQMQLSQDAVARHKAAREAAEQDARAARAGGGGGDSAEVRKLRGEIARLRAQLSGAGSGDALVERLKEEVVELRDEVTAREHTVMRLQARLDAAGIPVGAPGDTPVLARRPSRVRAFSWRSGAHGTSDDSDGPAWYSDEDGGARGGGDSPVGPGPPSRVKRPSSTRPTVQEAVTELLSEGRLDGRTSSVELTGLAGTTDLLMRKKAAEKLRRTQSRQMKALIAEPWFGAYAQAWSARNLTAAAIWTGNVPPECVTPRIAADGKVIEYG